MNRIVIFDSLIVRPIPSGAAAATLGKLDDPSIAGGGGKSRGSLGTGLVVSSYQTAKASQAGTLGVVGFREVSIVDVGVVGVPRNSHNKVDGPRLVGLSIDLEPKGRAYAHQYVD